MFVRQMRMRINGDISMETERSGLGPRSHDFKLEKVLE